MKRKLFFTLFVLLAAICQSQAQELWIPKWEKFVKVTADNVNLREAPSTSSRKLLGRNAGVFGAELSWEMDEYFEPYHLSKGNILPVLRESGDWYCLYLGNEVFGQLNDDYKVWIMKKFCQEATPVALGYRDYDLAEINRVKGAGNYLVGIYLLGSPSRAPYATFGLKSDNCFVMARYDNGMELINKFCTGESTMDVEFHSDQMKEADIERFVQSQKSPSFYHIWMRFAGEEPLRLFVIDATSYSHPVKKIPFADKKPAATSNENETKVFDIVEQMPQFPGGDSALRQWLGSHYVNDRGSEGRIIATFVVERDGSISDVKIVKSVNQWADAEFVRVLKAMPRWIPGKQNGSAVRVKYTVPITLRP